MRDRIDVFYYPEMVTSLSTIKKAILFFDEIHFMDRPSFMFGGFGGGQVGTIGCASPLRQYEASFRAEGVPLFVHEAPGGPVAGELYEQIKADGNDGDFLSRFQEGIRTSQSFRDLHIAHGNYGQFGTHEDVAKKMISVDLAAVLTDYGTAVDLFSDPNVRPFDLSTPRGCAKNLIFEALTCSAKMNFALNVSTTQGFIPLADASPYVTLLGAKYARAMKALDPVENKIQMTDLTFSVFDELVRPNELDKVTLKQAIEYRKASESAREEFLEYLAALQAKQSHIAVSADYAASIDQIIVSDIVPAARTFKKKLQAIDESLFGALAKGALGYAGTAGVSLFGDLSWQKLLGLAGLAGAYIGKAAVDALLAERAARRDCSISYILSLDT